MKQHVAIIYLVICLISCSQHSEHCKTLMQVESFIVERPDSALKVLQGIDIEELASKEDRAKYALLLSMALDKNYVDKTDFEVLQPAIDYYEGHGSSTDQMRTKFYEGRIYQNSGENTLAMSCFIEASELGDKSTDLRTKANTYYALSRIYFDLYTFDKSCENVLKAAKLYDAVNKPNNAFDCWATALNGYTLAKEYEEAEKVVAECKKRLPNVGYYQQVYYYRVYLNYLSNVEPIPIDEINGIIDRYCSLVPEVQWDYMTLTNAYIEIGNYDKALNLVNKWKISEDNDILNVKKYHIHSYCIYNHKGDYEKALKHFEEYTKIDEKQRYTATLQNVQFMEEKYALEMQKAKEATTKNRVLFIGILFGVVLIAIIIWLRSRLKIKSMEKLVADKEIERYKLLYQQVEEERDNLSELLSKNNEWDVNTRNAVAKRLELLNKFFTAYITHNIDIDRKANKEIEELLANKDTFMESTRLAFATSHPSFIKYLEEKGLTEWEISYCCLYALGLKGKEVGVYMKMSSHYNNSSCIREKLGLSETDTNLGIYIKKLLRSF